MPKNLVKYVVKDENTLGYLIEGSPFMGVLHGSVLKGGHDWKNGPVSLFGAVTRPATEDDFKAYRVALPCDFFGRLNAV